MPVFVSDDEQMVGLVVKIAVQCRIQQTLQHFALFFPVNAHPHLTVIDVAPAAAGFDRKLVVVGQVLRGGDTAAALGIVAFKIGQINVHHRLLQFFAVEDALAISVGKRHFGRQLGQVFFKLQNQIRSRLVDNADAGAQSVFANRFNAVFRQQSLQLSVIVDGRRNLIIIIFAA